MTCVLGMCVCTVFSASVLGTCVSQLCFGSVLVNFVLAVFANNLTLCLDNVFGQFVCRICACTCPRRRYHGAVGYRTEVMARLGFHFDAITS